MCVALTCTIDYVVLVKVKHAMLLLGTDRELLSLS